MGWLTGYTMRQPIIVDNTGNPSVVFDYQLRVNLNHDNFDFSKAKPDGSDIRFTTNDGISLLPYWIEKWDSVNEVAIVWVKVPSIPASDTTTIYMYYGNEDATSESNVTDTFIRVIEGVVGSWHFDEGSGDVAHDSSGNGNDGTLKNGPTWVNGKFGKALNFDGQDDYVEGSRRLNFVDFSAEAWVKLNDLAFTRGIFVADKTNYSKKGFRFYVSTQGNITLYMCDQYCNSLSTPSGIISPEEWYHITVVGRSRHFMKIYVNGELKAEKNTTQAVTPPADLPLIGTSQSASSYLKGLIDEFRVYNRPLTPDEISDLYNNYGYTTENYPGKVLVRKYISPEPGISVGAAECASSLSGIACDKYGNPIVGKSVKVFVFDKDTGKLLGQTASNSNNGSWTAQVSANPDTKVLTVLALEGDYNGDTDIAGAEFDITHG